MSRHKKFSSIGQTVDPLNPYITKSRKITRIIFHCSATVNGKNYDAHDVDNMHINRWGVNSGCGYHFVILPDGTVQKGRWSDYAGSHAGPDAKIGRKSENADTIAVVYIGGVDKNKVALKEGMNEKQRATAKILLNSLAKGYSLDETKILGHNELPKVNKACPCTNMDKLREEIKDVNN